MRRLTVTALATLLALCGPALAAWPDYDTAAAQPVAAAPKVLHRPTVVHRASAAKMTKEMVEQTASTPPASTTSTTASSAQQIDPLQWLKQFSASDLQNALTLAKAHNDIVSTPCWTFLLGVVNGQASNIEVPNQLGVATAIQVAMDDQAMLANWFTQGGTLDQINVACSPLIQKINITVFAGATSIAAGVAAGPAGAPALLAGLKAILGGATALSPLIASHL